MAEARSNETREDLLHVPNLYEFFCMRTSEDMRTRGGGAEPPTISFATLIITLLVAFAFYVFGKHALAKATFVMFGLLLMWTIWGVVVRSTEQVSQKADDIKSGKFPIAAAPFVMARLKWWNHLVAPLHWGKHSRLYDRRAKLERKLEDVERKIADLVAAAPPQPPYAPPSDAEVAEVAERITTFSARNAYETELGALPTELARLRTELVLYRALMLKIDELSEKLERIEKESVSFQAVSPEDLSQVVSEATQMLEERRILVLNVDAVDPDDFIDLVTVRV